MGARTSTAGEAACGGQHRLPVDEVWHFYLGDPVELLLLREDGGVSTPRLGYDVVGGEQVQLVVPAGTWMGAALAAGGHWALFGNTMAPGFRGELYEGGDPAVLRASWPGAADRIDALSRPDQPTRMPPGFS